MKKILTKEELDKHLEAIAKIHEEIRKFTSIVLEELNQTGTSREDWLDDLFEDEYSKGNKSLERVARNLKQSER